MDYIWDIIIAAKNQRIPLREINFKMAERFSPYMELSNSHINTREVEKTMEINPYYRFYSIFKDLFDVNYDQYLELRSVLFDIITHFLAMLDLYSGMDKIEFYKLFFYREMKNGSFGEIVRTGIDSFQIVEKNILVSNLYKLYLTGDHIFYMKKTIRDIFKGSIVYLNKIDKNEILAYIKQGDSPTNINKMNVIKALFLPLNFELKIYWKFHFGIISVNETMKINSISIY